MQVIAAVPKHYDHVEFRRINDAIIADPFNDACRVRMAAWLEWQKFDRVKSGLIRAQISLGRAKNRDERRAAKSDIFGLFRTSANLQEWHETSRILSLTKYDIGGDGFRFDPKTKNHLWYTTGFVSGISTTTANMLRSVANPAASGCGFFGQHWAKAFPLRGVLLHDREPEEYGGWYRWNNTEVVGGATEEARHYGKIGPDEFALASDVPKAVFDKMRSSHGQDKEGRLGILVHYRLYETPQDAKLDLEQASVNYLREAAGLKPVEWTPGPWQS